jgi:hypothetical protein
MKALGSVRSTIRPSLRLIAAAFSLLPLAFVAAPARADCLDYGGYLHYVAGEPIEDISYDYMGYEDMAIKGGRAYAYQYHYGLRVIDLTDPTQPTNRGIASGSYPVTGITCLDHFVIAAASANLLVYDVDDDDNPTRVLTQPAGATVYDVAVHLRRAYVAAAVSGLQVWDFDNPLAPELVTTLPTSSAARTLCLNGNLLLVGCAGRLDIFSLADPDAPVLVGSAATGDITEIAAEGDVALIEMNWDGARRASLVDLSDPTAPALWGTPFGEDVTAVALRDGAAWLGCDPSAWGGSLERYDVADPSAPVRIGRDVMLGWPQAIGFAFGYLFTADGGDYLDGAYTEGFHVFDPVSPASPPAYGRLDLPGSCLASALRGNWLYVVDSRGLNMVNVTDPSAPSLMNSLNWYEGYGDGALIVPQHLILSKWDVDPGSHWLESYNLDIPGSPAYRATFALGEGDLLLKLAARGDLIFFGWAGSDGIPAGIRVVRVDAQGAMQQLGSFWEGLRAGMSALESDGTRAAIAVADEGLRLVELSDPLAPVVLASLPPAPGLWREVFAWEGGRIYAGLELLEEYWPEDRAWEIIDASNPAAPVVLCRMMLPFEEAVSDIVVEGSVVYVVAYRMTYIYNAADPEAPVLIGTMPHEMVYAYPHMHAREDCLITTEYTGEIATWPHQCDEWSAVSEPDGTGPAEDPWAPGGPRETTGLRFDSVPSPFVPGSEVAFVLPAGGDAELSVFDCQGRCVRRLLDAVRPAGPSAVAWDGRDDEGHSLSDGVWLVRLVSGGRTVTTRVLLAR